MKHSRLVSLTCAMAMLAASGVSAQSGTGSAVPAEFPPTSFEGRQYVDSTGCVFVRAGVSGNVTWVPRLTRDRAPVCGFEPTFATRAEAPAPREPAPAPAQTAQTAPPDQPTSPPPARPAQTAAAAPVTTPSPSVRPTPAASAVRIARPDPTRTACQTDSGASAASTVQHNGSPVRCGPQAAAPVTYAKRRPARAVPPPGTVVTRDMVPPGTRVTPARIYSKQRISKAGVSVPAGMQPVWDDDRLNPRRAHQTFDGMDQMKTMWTDTVPRRLIERRSGAAVTREITAPQPVSAAAPEQPTRTTLSTRSRPAPASHRYAQAGIFADAAQANAAAQRIARAGLPARRGSFTRDGRELTLVLAGPFATQAQLSAGAGRLRAMGFANVTLRK